MKPEDLASLDAEWCNCCGYFLAYFWQPEGAGHLAYSTYSPKAIEDWLTTVSARGWSLAGHNIRSDFHTLGVYPEGVEVLDSLVLSWLTNENGSHKLKELAPRVLGRELEDPITVKEKEDGTRVTYFKGVHIKDADQNDVLKYCREDAKATLDLALYYWNTLPENLKKWYLEVEQPLDRVVFEMEQRGIRLDTDRMLTETLALRKQTAELREKLYAEVGYVFNEGSPLQVGKVLFTKEWQDKERGFVGVYKACRTHKKPVDGEFAYYKCHCPVESKTGWVPVTRKGLGLKARKKTPTGQPAVDDEVLAHFEKYEVVRLLLEYRAAEKVLGTYLEAFPRFMQPTYRRICEKGSPSEQTTPGQDHQTVPTVRDSLRTEGIPGVPGLGRLGSKEVLFDGVLEHRPDGTGEPCVEGRDLPSGGVRIPVRPGPPQRQQEVCGGTSAGGREKTREVPAFGRGRTPPQRSAGRQPAGEPSGAAQLRTPCPSCGQVPECELVYEGDRLYGHFHTTGTVTGRFSSSDPNLQNIPARGDLGRRVRGLFIPEPGHLLVVADADQLELRLLASFCKDPALLQAFESGEDVHQTTADLMGVDRDLAKNINYSIAYDASAKTVRTKYAPHLSLEEVQAAMDKHRRTFPMVYEWKDRVRRFARQHGFVYTIGMRKRHLPDIRSFDQRLRHRAERQAVNCVIQGSAADIFRKAMAKLEGFPLLLQVHDELVFEAPTEQSETVAKEVRWALRGAAKELGVGVPITCSPRIVNSWGQAKEKPQKEAA